MNDEIPEELWDALPQLQKPVQKRVWVNADNANFLDEMEKANCSNAAIINLALDLLKPKLQNHNFTFENIEKYAKRLPKQN
jgi:hypothetical protein